MKVRSIILVGSCLVMGAAAAESKRGADTPECKVIIARLIELTDATFDRYSPSGDTVFFKNPYVVLACTSPRLTGISVPWDESGFPPNAWFGLVAMAGMAVTGVDVKKLESASRRCHRSALKDKSELAEFEIPNAKIECQAFTRDGGGVQMSIWKRDH